jgi:hypothetical protein
VDGSGLLTFKPESVGIQQLVVFNASGSFTKASYPGLRKVHVRVIGGGGGGAGAQATGGPSIAGSSGSGGGYSESLLDASALGASETVAIGVGGAGGVGNSAGAVGGTSSFGSFVIAFGGLGGLATMPQGANEWTVAGAQVGPVGSGQIGVTGSPGGYAHRSPIDTTTCQVGPGGDGGGGYGAGGATQVGDTGTGYPATGYGGGGGGAVSFGASFNGGNGSQGGVFLTLYF